MARPGRSIGMSYAGLTENARSNCVQLSKAFRRFGRPWTILDTRGSRCRRENPQLSAIEQLITIQSIAQTRLGPVALLRSSRSLVHAGVAARVRNCSRSRPQQHRYPPVAVAHVRSAASVVICRATCRNGATGLADRQGTRYTQNPSFSVLEQVCHSLRRRPCGNSRPNGRRVEMKRRSRASSRQLAAPGAPGRSFLISESATHGRSGDGRRRPPPPLRRSANSRGALSAAATALCLAPSINGMDEFANTIAPAASIGSNQLSKRCTTVSFWGSNESAFVVTLVSGVGQFSDAHGIAG